MEEIILKIINNDLGIFQILALLLIFLIFLVKNRKTNEKIDLISENHLHEISEALRRIENKIENGFKDLNDKINDVSKAVEIIKVIKENKK